MLKSKLILLKNSTLIAAFMLFIVLDNMSYKIFNLPKTFKQILEDNSTTAMMQNSIPSAEEIAEALTRQEYEGIIAQQEIDKILEYEKQIQQYQNEAEISKQQIIYARKQRIRIEQAINTLIAQNNKPVALPKDNKTAKTIESKSEISSPQETSLNNIETYIAKFQKLIEDNLIVPTTFKANISCKVRIKILPDGTIASAKLVKASGYPAYDKRAISSIYKSSPFPMPDDEDLYNNLRDIILEFENE